MDKQVDFDKVEKDTLQSIRMSIGIIFKGFDLSILDKCKRLLDKGYSNDNDLNSLNIFECMEFGTYCSLIINEIFNNGRFDELCQLLK